MGYWTKLPQKGDICCCPACNKLLYRITEDLRMGDKITEALFEAVDGAPKVMNYHIGWYYCPDCHYHRWYNENQGFHIQSDGSDCLYHDYVDYVGFTEKYKYCTKCGNKRWPSK